MEKKKRGAPPKYDEAFKTGAVKMVTESNRPVKEVAEQLGICRETLVSWLKKRKPLMFYTSRVGYGQKIRRHIPKTIEEKYHFVDKHRCKHSVERLCRELGISRSSYYDSKSKKPSRRALSNQLLLREIVRLHEKYPVYGLDSIYNILRRKYCIEEHEFID